MESPFLGFQKSHKDWFKFEKNYVATKKFFEYIFWRKISQIVNLFLERNGQILGLDKLL